MTMRTQRHTVIFDVVLFKANKTTGAIETKTIEVSVPLAVPVNKAYDLQEYIEITAQVVSQTANALVEDGEKGFGNCAAARFKALV